MRKIIRLLFSLMFCVVLINVIVIRTTYASTLSGAKDTISTSRPSASAPLYADQPANDTAVTVFDNNSVFLASDSATIIPDSNETINVGIPVASMSASQQSPTTISYWKLDESSGPSPVDSASGLPSNWVGTGAATSSVYAAGKINNAGNFDGTTNYINVNNFTSLQLYTVSIVAWIKTSNAGSSYRGIISKQTAYGMFLNNNSFSTYDWNTGLERPTGINLADGNWHMVAMTVKSGIVNGTQLWIDGVLKLTTTVTVSSQSTNLTIGAGAPASQLFAGQIDEPSVYNKVLTASEISRLYNAGAGIQYPNFLLNTRTVYFASAISNAHHQGDTVIAPVTAKHIIQFTPITGVASTGKIVVSFPGIGSNSASPSATTFAFNNLQASNISTTGASCGSYTLSPPNITCNLNALLSPGTPVTMTIGSITPALVNPTKANVAGTADSWRMTLQTTDASGVVLDDAKIAIATVDAVKVYGDVDPSITFTITGVNNGVALSTQASGCADSTQNAQSTTPTEVNLGFLRNGQINMAAQLLSVSTNGAQGYVISATSSGKLMNPTTGWGIYGMNGDIGMTANDTPVPATFRASGLEGFGISACGPRTGVNSNQWGASSCTTAFSSGCKYANPWNTGTNSYYSTLASYTGGPVSNDLTVVKYAATISGTTPPGNYRTVFTYVATATF